MRGGLRREGVDTLQDRGVDDVEQQHRLEEGIGELGLGVEELSSAVGLRGDESLGSALIAAGCGL